MSQEIISRLAQQLQEYGLNPNHWRFKVLTERRGRLVHKDDPNVCIVGRIKDGRWEDLLLIA